MSREDWVSSDIPEETREVLTVAIERAVRVRELEQELSWAHRDHAAALLKVDPADGNDYVVGLSNALAEATGG